MHTSRRTKLLIISALMAVVIASAAIGGVTTGSKPANGTPTAPTSIQVPATLPADSPRFPTQVTPRSSQVLLYPGVGVPTTKTKSYQWSQFSTRGKQPQAYAIPMSSTGWSTIWLMTSEGVEFDHPILWLIESTRFLVRTADIRSIPGAPTWTGSATDDGPVPIGYHGPVKAQYPIKLYSLPFAGKTIRKQIPVHINTRWNPIGFPTRPVATPRNTSEMLGAGCSFMWVYPSPNPKFLIGWCPLNGGKAYAVERSAVTAFPSALAAGWCAPTVESGTRWQCAASGGGAASPITRDYRGFAQSLTPSGMTPRYGSLPVPSEIAGNVPPMWPWPDGNFIPRDYFKVIGDAGNGLATVQFQGDWRYVVPWASITRYGGPTTCPIRGTQWPCINPGVGLKHGRLR